MPPPARAPPRPGGVTFACVLSMAWGALGALFGLAVFAVGGFLGFIPVVGPFLAAGSLFIGGPILAIGILGIVAGAKGMNGESWARWAMVVMFGLGAFAMFATIVVAAANVTAIVMLVKKDAQEWFDHHERARTLRPM